MISRGLEEDAGALGDLPGPRSDHIITVFLSCGIFAGKHNQKQIIV